MGDGSNRGPALIPRSISGLDIAPICAELRSSTRASPRSGNPMVSDCFQDARIKGAQRRAAGVI